MHREESNVEAHEHQPETELAQALAQHATREFREPKMERAEEREDSAADEHVMKRRDDEERVVDLKVERHARLHDAGQSAEDEDEEEADDEKQRRSKARPPAPQRRNPTEDLDPTRNGDHHARRREEARAELRQAGREHVMDPEA